MRCRIASRQDALRTIRLATVAVVASIDAMFTLRVRARTLVAVAQHAPNALDGAALFGSSCLLVALAPGHLVDRREGLAVDHRRAEASRVLSANVADALRVALADVDARAVHDSSARAPQVDADRCHVGVFDVGVKVLFHLGIILPFRPVSRDTGDGATCSGRGAGCDGPACRRGT